MPQKNYVKKDSTQYCPLDEKAILKLAIDAEKEYKADKTKVLKSLRDLM